MSRTKPDNVFMRPPAPPMAAHAALAIIGSASIRAAGFESVGKADEAFRAAGDEAGRAEAYGWMTNRLASSRSPAEIAQTAQLARRAAHLFPVYFNGARALASH